MLALFGRAEPRDFVDVYVLTRQFSKDQLLEWAAGADPGFSKQTFARMLLSHTRLADGDLPDVSVAVETIRTFFDAWAAELEAR